MDGFQGKKLRSRVPAGAGRWSALGPLLCLASACQPAERGERGTPTTTRADGGASVHERAAQERLDVLALPAAWPRSMRYAPMVHLYAGKGFARITLEVGADYDGSCIYALEPVELEGAGEVLASRDREWRGQGAIVVHVTDDVDFARIAEALRPARSSGLRAYLSTSSRVPETRSAGDCIPASAVFDGPNQLDPFQRPLAVAGGCGARCVLGATSDDEACVAACIERDLRRAMKNP